MAVISPKVNLEVPKLESITDYIFGTENSHNSNGTQFINQRAFTDSETDEFITHSQLRKNAELVASGLINKYNIQSGDVVAIFSPNHIRYPEIFLGAMNAGIIVTTSNPIYTEKELTHQLKDSNSKLLFTTESGLSTSTKVIRNLSKPIPIIVMDPKFKAKGKIMPLSQLYSNLPYSRLEFSASQDNTKVPSVIVYSSGTTGLPKGVVTTHHNLIANLIQSEYALKGKETPGKTVTGLLPFFHSYGIMMVLLHGIHNYFHTIVIKKFDLKQFFGAIEKYKIEWLSLAPPVILQLARNPMVENFNLSSVKFIMSGAAPLPSDVGKRARDRLGCQLFQGYGMTESSPVITISDPDSPKVESAGLLVPNIAAKIVDPGEGKLLSLGSTGEIWIKGPNLMKEYLNNPKATSDMFDNEGFLKTGDIGYFDKDEDLFIVDRVKELIKYKGYQIAPAELEEVLISHPRVKDCCVIGINDPKSGEELPKAFVVTDDNGGKVNLNEIREYAHTKLAPYKHLRGGMEPIKEIPKSTTGKILRRVLKDMEAQRRKSPL